MNAKMHCTLVPATPNRGERIYTCRVHNKPSCISLQNYTKILHTDIAAVPNFVAKNQKLTKPTNRTTNNNNNVVMILATYNAK